MTSATAAGDTLPHASSSGDAAAGGAADILRRARREAERYGDDPWVFLRELVQNARDAGASRITLTTHRDVASRTERIRCDDDGVGMSASLVETGLLRLFSSQKQHAGAAGCFGVGFWSTLRFDPTRVRVDTNDGSAAISIVVDVATGSVSEVPATRRERGTTVSLERRAQYASAAQLAQVVRDTTARSSGCLEPLPGRARPLLTVDGVDVRRKLADDCFDDGDPRAKVSGEGFRGVVGFGRRPRIEVYVHGLLVKEALALDELLPSRPAKSKWAPGLWPVVAVEAPGVTVLLDRQAIVEDALVWTIVETCEATLAGLLEKLLDELVPLPWWRRLLQRASRKSTPLAYAAALVGGLAVGGVAAHEIVERKMDAGAAVEGSAAPWRAARTGVVDGAAPSSPPGMAREPPRFVEDVVPFDQPRIDELRAGDSGWSISVETTQPLLLLRLRVLDVIDAQRGIVSSTPAANGAQRMQVATVAGSSDDVIADVSFAARGALPPLPHAPRTLVDMVTPTTRPVLVDGNGLFHLRRGDGDGVGTVRYRLRRTRPSVEAASTSTPPLVTSVLPPRLQELALSVRSGARTRRERVALAERLVRERLRYAADADTRDALDGARGTFFERVDAVGAGDCDVMNAVLAAVLHEVDIPARVVVGLVVQDGRVAPTLHAWTEAFVDGAIVVADASPAVALATGDRTAPARSSSEGLAQVTGSERLVVVDSAPRGAPRSPIGTDDIGDGTEPNLAALDRALRATEAPGDADVDARGAGASAGAGTVVDAPDARLRTLPPRTLALAGGAALLVSIAMIASALWLAARARRRRLAARGRDDVDLTSLFVQALRRGPRSDPLGLWHRRFLPRHRARPLSLREAERLAQRGLLCVADATRLPMLRHALDTRARGGASVLVAGDPRVEAVRAHLFGLVDLERAAAALALPADPRASAVEALASTAEPRVAARIVPGRGIVELALPFASPRVLILLGADDAGDVAAACALYRKGATLARRAGASS